MNLFPIVRREFLAASRRGAIYRTRYWTGGIACLGALTALGWANAVWMFSSSPGFFLFYFTGLTTAFFCVASGIALTLDAITSERRQGTLGLLFLTELSGLDVVLGKLASALIAALGSFLTVIPVLAIAVCLGGITGIQFWRLSLALAALLWFSLCLGLFLSAVSVREGIGIPLYCAVISAPSLLLGYDLLKGRAPSDLVLITNPFYPLFTAFELRPGPNWPPYWQTLGNVSLTEYRSSLMWIFFVGVGLLALTSAIAPRLIRDRKFAPQRFGRFKKFFLGDVKVSAKSEGTLGLHPVAWVHVRDRQPIIAIWALFAAGTAFLVWDPLESMGIYYQGLCYVLFLQFTLKWVAAFQAGRFISQEKETGFLEALLTTPINPGVIVQSKKRALRRYFLFPLIYALVMHLWLIANNTLEGPGAPVLWITVASAIILVVDIFSLTSIGLWEGLVARNSYRAFFRTIMFGVAQPFLPFFFFTGVIWFIVGKDFKPNPALFAAWAYSSSAVFTLAMGLWCFARLHFQLRKRLAQAY